MTETPLHRVREDCRGCGSRDMVRFLDLGPQPAANALLVREAEFEREPRFPLEVWFCPACSLVQLRDVVDPQHLFGHYLYLTGMSSTMLDHFDAYAAAVCADHGLGREDLVVEVASNDGSLLASFAARGVSVLGVEPAANVAEIARDNGVPTEERFFDEAVGAELVAAHGHARVVCANNVLAHVDDPGGFLRGMRRLAGEQGICVVEVPYLGELLDRFEYDTIYHEHLSYFSIAALAHLFESADLAIVRIERVPVHGGSLRVHARSAALASGHATDVHAAIEEERDAGLLNVARYEAFGQDVARHREELRALVTGLRERGQSIAAYGAPAKGNTLLNSCGLGADVIAFTVDRNPLKTGRFTPGTHIPILETTTLLERQPDYVMILPWNIAEEIMAQEAAYRESGGRFIIPIPEPRIA